jgi:hypothetical protein
MSEEETTREQHSTVLQSASTTQQPSVLLTYEDLMRFDIGLALLGEKKRQNYLTYLQKLRDETQPGRNRGTPNDF